MANSKQVMLEHEGEAAQTGHYYLHGLKRRQLQSRHCVDAESKSAKISCKLALAISAGHLSDEGIGQH